MYFANTFDQTDRNDVSTKGNILDFANAQVSSNSISHTNFEGSIVDFTGSSVTVGSKLINLGVYFDKGIAESEINKNTGDIIYIDNRSLVERDSRQKEDVKIILEF